MRECAAELQRRRDTILEALAGLPIVRPAGGWSLLIDTRRSASSPPTPSRALLGGRRGDPDDRLGRRGRRRHIRFVFSAEPVERLAELGGLVAGLVVRGDGLEQVGEALRRAASRRVGTCSVGTPSSGAS